MPRLPSITPDEAIRAFEKAGFRRKRQKGSHVFLNREGHHTMLCIPVHAGDLKRGVLRSEIRKAGLTVEEFLNLL